MNKNSKLVISLLSAALMGTSFSALAASSDQQGDIFIPAQGQQVSEDFVKTSSARATAGYPDFTRVAESTINSVVSIKNFQYSQVNPYLRKKISPLSKFDRGERFILLPFVPWKHQQSRSSSRSP